MGGYAVELLGILIALALLIFLAFRGYTLLLAAPAAAIVAAAFSGEPLLAKWTLTFMQGTGRFITNFFPLFLLGGVFGKLMDDSGAALSTARTITERLGETRAVLAVVLSCAALTYGGVSLFVVAFAVFPVADALFRQAAGGRHQFRRSCHATAQRRSRYRARDLRRHPTWELPRDHDGGTGGTVNRIDRCDHAGKAIGDFLTHYLAQTLT
jgi:hypothetical protein